MENNKLAFIGIKGIEFNGVEFPHITNLKRVDNQIMVKFATNITLLKQDDEGSFQANLLSKNVDTKELQNIMITSDNTKVKSVSYGVGNNSDAPYGTLVVFESSDFKEEENSIADIHDYFVDINSKMSRLENENKAIKLEMINMKEIVNTIGGVILQDSLDKISADLKERMTIK